MENQDHAAADWSRVQLLAFRFAFVYFILYFLPFPFGALPHTGSVAQKYESFWHKLVPWFGKHVLHLSHEIMTSTNCSGDTTYDYVRVLPRSISLKLPTDAPVAPLLRPAFSWSGDTHVRSR
jgi:hypothetical protein